MTRRTHDRIMAEQELREARSRAAWAEQRLEVLVGDIVVVSAAIVGLVGLASIAFMVLP